MNLTVKTYPNNTAPKLTYDVLIENQKDGGVSAAVLGLPDFKGSGVTKEEALEKLIQLLQEREPEIVTLEIEPAQTEHPWMKFAGMFKDDPQFNEMLAYIEADRRELDARMEEYYQQLDAENETK
jgi:predicted RNase H-like HicB family nuclease